MCMIRLANTLLLWPVLLLTAQAAAENDAAPRPPITASYLQTLLDKANFIEFAREFPHAAGLKPEQELYFKGTLAYREGHFQEVIDPLIAAVKTEHTSLTAAQVESAFEILGQTAAKTYLYA